MAMPRSGVHLLAGSELRTHASLLVESIALRHQIALLERSRTRRPCFRRRFNRLLWILLSRWWPQWRESRVIVEPETVLRLAPVTAGPRSGDIGHLAAGEVGVRGSPVRSAI